MIVAGVTLVAGAAFAQATSPAPKAITPGANPTAPAPSLSKELSRSNGVIHPKEVDPGIEKAAPKTRGSQCRAAAGEFGRRARAAGKVSAAFGAGLSGAASSTP